MNLEDPDTADALDPLISPLLDPFMEVRCVCLLSTTTSGIHVSCSAPSASPWWLFNITIINQGAPI